MRKIKKISNTTMHERKLCHPSGLGGSVADPTRHFSGREWHSGWLSKRIRKRGKRIIAITSKVMLATWTG